MAEGRTSGSGNGKPRRVKITVPEQYRAVSDEVWTDLETYLYRGFLTSPAHVVGKTIVFKTINHLELENVSLLRPMRQSPPEVAAHYRAAFIAYSVFVVDGVNVLHGRPDHIAQLVKIFSKLSQGVQEEIVSQLSALNVYLDEIGTLGATTQYIKRYNLNFSLLSIYVRALRLLE